MEKQKSRKKSNHETGEYEMNGSMLSKSLRLFIALALFAVTGLALAQPVQAASPFITITAVKVDESATVHATGLPADMTFTVRMGTADVTTATGAVVGEVKSGADGTFDATFTIPAALKGKATIAVRIDAARGGWFAYNWFTNKTQGTVSGTPVPIPTTTPTSTPTTTTPSSPSTTASRMFIQVIAVDMNKTITVTAVGFPANVDFQIRVGPFATFSRNQANVATVSSGKGGSFSFNVALPDIVKDITTVTIRLDGYSGSTHLVSYNLFTNASKGTVSSDPSASTPGATPTPSTAPVSTQSKCQILSVIPASVMPVSWDFDAIWEVKNTSSETWDMHAVDYRYASGEKLNKLTAPYDLPISVKPGETVKLLADMLAPAKTGTFSTTFVLVGDQGTLCTLPLTITVK
jgi:hypothetical protein